MIIAVHRTVELPSKKLGHVTSLAWFRTLFTSKISENEGEKIVVPIIKNYFFNNSD